MHTRNGARNCTCGLRSARLDVHISRSARQFDAGMFDHLWGPLNTHQLHFHCYRLYRQPAPREFQTLGTLVFPNIPSTVPTVCIVGVIYTANLGRNHIKLVSCYRSADLTGSPFNLSNQSMLQQVFYVVHP